MWSSERNYPSGCIFKAMTLYIFTCSLHKTFPQQRPMHACMCVCMCVCLCVCVSVCVCVCCSSQGISVKRCTKLWSQHFYGIIWKTLIRYLGFPSSSVSKEPACSAGDPGSIPGSRRSPGEGNGNPLHILAWKILRTEKPGGLQSMGSQELNVT